MRVGSMLLCVCIAVGVVAGVALAARPTSTQEQQIRAFKDLLEKHKALMEAKEYDQAADVGKKMTELLPGVPLGHYNLACALARAGKKDEAIAALTKAVERGYDKPTYMMQDEDLASIREDPRMADLAKEAQANESAKGAPYEKGEEVAGTKTVEGNPPEGLRWRLRMSPDATKEKPNRLIVWLHPDGLSLNPVIEAMAPRFLKQGYALLVFTHKAWAAWTGDDKARLLKTLEDVAKVEGVDVTHPILLGVSAGGQAAFELWSQGATTYGGLALAASCPEVWVKGVKMGPLPLPKEEVAKAVPIFALVGQKDAMARSWQKLEPTLRQLGVPLVLRYVPEKGHEWLFDEAHLVELDAWLAKVAAGERPSDPVPAPAAVEGATP